VSCPLVGIRTPHSLSRKRESPFPESKREGTHSPAGEGVEGPNSEYWRKSLVLCDTLYFDAFLGGRVNIAMEESFMSILSLVNGGYCDKT
jgi:hypothetical protein